MKPKRLWMESKGVDNEGGIDARLMRGEREVKKGRKEVGGLMWVEIGEALN